MWLNALVCDEDEDRSAVNLADCVGGDAEQTSVVTRVSHYSYEKHGLGEQSRWKDMIRRTITGVDDNFESCSDAENVSLTVENNVKLNKLLSVLKS